MLTKLQTRISFLVLALTVLFTANITYALDQTSNSKGIKNISCEQALELIEKHKSDSIDQVYSQLSALPNESIYDGSRLAQPDEVANYRRGDGVEKAMLLCNIIRDRSGEETIEIDIDNQQVTVKAAKDYLFKYAKGLSKQLRL